MPPHVQGHMLDRVQDEVGKRGVHARGEGGGAQGVMTY